MINKILGTDLGFSARGGVRMSTKGESCRGLWGNAPQTNNYKLLIEEGSAAKPPQTLTPDPPVNRKIARSHLLCTSLIKGQIGRHEVLLPIIINSNYKLSL